MTTDPSLSKKMKFSIKNFVGKCDQNRRKQQSWSHLLKKFLMENFIFCAVFPYPSHMQEYADL